MFVTRGRADPNVVVSAFANPEYTKRKYTGEKPLRETYVVMRGQYFEAPMVDKSIDRMPFERIVGFFAEELSRREYWPAKDAKEADLLIAVHWGTTARESTATEMLGRTSNLSDASTSPALMIHDSLMTAYATTAQDIMLEWERMADPVGAQYHRDGLDLLADRVGVEMGRASTAQLLGYTRDLRAFNKNLNISTEEVALRFQLATERYFIILKAYDLREKGEPGRTRKAVWTLHLNMRSPGTNFKIALDRMSAVSVNYFGRATDEVTTIRPTERQGKVEVGVPVVVGDRKK